MTRQFSTPMMQQYAAIKEQYKDCLLFFRLGDFYELFLDDAIVGAKVLDIILTRRPRGKDGDIPMAGVPYHAADVYIAKLVRAGHKIAICEQVSEPDKKGIVERKVVRIVTPGTILDEKTLTAKEHNYTMSISIGENIIGIAVADISTGDFQVTEREFKDSIAPILAQEYARFTPAECIVNTASYNSPTLLKHLTQERSMNVSIFQEWDEHAEYAEKNLKRHFKVKSLRGFGLTHKDQAIKAAGTLLGYLSHTQQNRIGHMTSLCTYEPEDHVILDASTISNLELFKSIREHDDQGAFIQCIDQTQTAGGGRLLRQWIREPLRNKTYINERLSAVESLIHERSIREKARNDLCSMYDIERILSRLSVGIGNPHDLINLKHTLKSTLKVHSFLSDIKASLVQELIAIIPDAQHISTYIESMIVEIPPFDPKSGGLINKGVNTELDDLHESIRESKEWIARLEGIERNQTGIGSLKVKFNNVFGYYIEISKSNLHLVPKHYIRKQTTVNAERFITEELQKYEDIVLRGQDLINKLEYKIFFEVIEYILKDIVLLQKTAEHIAIIDCLLGFAAVAERERYIRPVLTNDGDIKIEDGRHPVVEQLRDTSFVPNNTFINQSDHQLLVITGPNMAGKSVYMRQVALIVLMAHIGSYVPAKRASISLVDRIFVRSGASDNIGRGLSTFMVEMTETAYILHHATPQSLIIMDEIGRGTSTYDGISIAWAIAEYLVTNNEHSAKTLFATHYHELQQLEKQYPSKIKNFHMAIEESSKNPVFLYRLTSGGALGSYAIAVARLAGVPSAVAKRAEELLETFGEKE
ncbi:DNA mismatch repair protein MutS [Patescibacteria group bacterium]|nr:DNA mismatch repair protein MutS [Patescibacteria group bacterium]